MLLGGALAGWLAALALLRFGWFEIDPELQPCHAAPDGFACALRSAFGTAVYTQSFGRAALLVAFVSMVVRPSSLRAPAALLALAAGCWALMFYNADLGSVASVIALLVLVRRWHGPA